MCALVREGEKEKEVCLHPLYFRQSLVDQEKRGCVCVCVFVRERKKEKEVYLFASSKFQTGLGGPRKRGCACVCVSERVCVFACGGPAACFMWLVINCCDISPL